MSRENCMQEKWRREMEMKIEEKRNIYKLHNILQFIFELQLLRSFLWCTFLNLFLLLTA